MENTEIKERSKPQYGMISNTGYMIRTAWGECRSLVIILLLQVLLAVSGSLLELLITPAVLGRIEIKAPLTELLQVAAALLFGLLLVKSCDSYTHMNISYGQSRVRMELLYRVEEKFGRTSYSNLAHQSFQRAYHKSTELLSSNASPAETVWKTIALLLQSMLGFLIYLALLSSVDSVIIVITLLTTIGGYLLGNRISQWEYEHKDEEAKYVQRIHYINQRSGQSEIAKDIRVFGMQGWLKDVYWKWYRAYYTFHVRAEKMYLLGNVVDIFLSFLRNGAAYIYLIHMTLENQLSAAQFLLYFTAVGGFTEWITMILNQMSTLRRQSLDISFLREFLDKPEEFKFSEGESVYPEHGKDYTLELKNVSYRYPEAEKYTLKNINLTLHPGEKLAVVGVNGAGKTTLIKLLCGFVNPTEGQVLLNGNDIRNYNREDYYNFFSAVFQDFSLLAETVEENVSQRETTDRERVRLCLKKAGILEMVEALPKGLDSHMVREVHDDGVEFSGGQLQRLMLARALYKDAPVLILDEPTAALDPLAESDIYMRYRDLSQGKSCVFISHRLASTRFCDRIILISSGKIREEGTHESLLAEGGEYAGLFEIQRKYYQTEGDESNENET